MKNIILICLSTFCAQTIFCDLCLGQTTFSKQYTMGLSNGRIQSIEVNNDNIYAFGAGIDSITPFKNKVTFNIIDLDGTLLSEKWLDRPNVTLNRYHNTSKIFNDTIFDFVNIIENNGVVNGGFIKMTLEGDTIVFNKFKNFYYPSEDFMGIFSLEVNQLSVAILYQSFKPSQTIINDGQLCILNLSKDGLLNWHQCYGTILREWPTSIINDREKGYYISGYRSDDYQTGPAPSEGDAHSYSLIMRLDSAGNKLWEYQSEDEYESANALVLAPDGNLIVASGYGKEICNDAGNNCNIAFTGEAYKLNTATREKMWETKLEEGLMQNWGLNTFYDITESIEKDGYVLAGSGYDTFSCTGQIDSKCFGIPGWIVKIGNNGDSLWSRKYSIVESTLEQHIFFDIEIGPDSSYIMAGESLNLFGGFQSQQGWILKTDRFGCLVPGCHLISSTTDGDNSEVPDSYFSTYPNPTTDFINVLIKKDNITDPQVRLFDMSGREVSSFTNIEKGSTYMIPVYDLSPGMYLVQLMSNKGILQVEKVVVQ